MLASPDSPSLLRLPKRNALYRIEHVSPFFKGGEGEGGRRVSLYRSPVGGKGGVRCVKKLKVRSLPSFFCFLPSFPLSSPSSYVARRRMGRRFNETLIVEVEVVK